MTHLRKLVQSHENLKAIKADEVFIQGSYATKSLVRPLNGGGFDVDVGFPVTPKFTDAHPHPRPALDYIAAQLNQSKRIKGSVKVRSKCIRIPHSEGFHLDLVPLRTVEGKHPHQVADGSQWTATTPKELGIWMRTVNRDTDGLYGRCLKYLKRWQDHRGLSGQATPSVALAILAGTHHPFLPNVKKRFPKLHTKTARTDAAFFTDTVTAMEHTLHAQGTNLSLPNPVHGKEKLHERLTREQLNALRGGLSKLKNQATSTLKNPDEDKSARQWRSVFGDAFPLGA